MAVSVSSDTDRPGFHRREAVPAQTMRKVLQLSPSPVATFLRCREGIGYVSRKWLGSSVMSGSGLDVEFSGGFCLSLIAVKP